MLHIAFAGQEQAGFEVSYILESIRQRLLQHGGMVVLYYFGNDTSVATVYNSASTSDRCQ